MSNVVALVRQGINNRCAAVLSGWSSLVFLHDVARNAQSKANNRYGVLARGATQTPGATCAYTMSHEYEVILTKVWVSTVDGDSALTTAQEALFQEAHKIYKDVSDTKCGVPASVLVVRDALLTSPEILEDQKIIVQRLQFTVLYRVSV